MENQLRINAINLELKREKVAALCVLRFSELKTFGPCLIFVRAANLSRKYWNYGIILLAIKINKISNLKQIPIMELQYLQISLLLLI